MITRHRTIRSYVLRQGRVTDAQRRARDEMLPRFGVPFSHDPLDLERVFGRAAPKILEIGFGMGETTADIASRHPGNDYLGVEVHTPGVGSLLKRIAGLGLTNVRVIQHDAVEVIEHMIPRASLDGVHIFFPDPWPKKRHHKRRFFQPATLDAVAGFLEPDARMHVATDHEDYWAAIEPLVDGHTAFERLPDFGGEGFPGDPSRPLTNFEAKYVVEGRRRNRGSWRRTPS